MSKKKIKNYILTSKAFSLFLIIFIRLLCMTYRISHHNKPPKEKMTAAVLFAFWHQNILNALTGYIKTPVGLMISASKDGEMVARVMEGLGFKTARGSSHRDGKQALESMIQLVEEKTSGAITVDGPTGPAFKVKSGIIEISRRTGATILPVCPLPKKYIALKSWDKFRLPIPFTKIIFYYGNPINIKNDINSNDFEMAKLHLENEIHHCEKMAKELL